MVKVKSMTLQNALPKKQTAKHNDIDTSTATSKLAAWLTAPLPQFYDLQLATAMVNEGHYPSLDKAYLEIPESRKAELRENSDQYYKNCRSVNLWQNAPLPSSPERKK